MVELAAVCGSTAMIYLMHTPAAAKVAAAPAVGSPGLVAELASGRALGTLAFSERGSWFAFLGAGVGGYHRR